MKRMLKSTLAICLVLMMVLSTIAVSATTTEAEAAELTTVYTKDFTKDTDLTGWTNQSAVSYSATDKKVNIAAKQTVFYENDLGDNFNIKSTLGYGWNCVKFIINGDGENANNGIVIDQHKENIAEPFVDGDALHEAYKESKPDAKEYMYFVEYIDITINGKTPTDWKKIVYVDETHKDRDSFTSKYTEENAVIYNNRQVKFEYSTEELEIGYNNGLLTFKGVASGETREFTYDVTQNGAVVPPSNKGYFGITADSGTAWLYNIEVQKELSDYVTVYEQDFTKAGATTEGWSIADMTVTENEGLVADGSLIGSMVYNKDLGKNYRIKGSIYQGYFGPNFLINSDAKIESGSILCSQGYKLLQNKNNGTEVKKIANSSETTVYAVTEAKYDAYRNFDFEIINKNGKVEYIYSDNGTMLTNAEYDLPSYTSGKFAIVNNTVDGLKLKNIKIEVIPDDYVTVFDEDFTESGLTIEDIKGLGIDLTSGATVTVDNGLTLTNSGEALVINKNVGKKYRVSGQIKARCWQDEVMTQYNTHYKMFLNSDASIENDDLSVANAYRIDINKDCNEMTLLVDGKAGYNHYWFWRNADTSHTSVNNVFVNFAIESDGEELTYTVTSLDGATQYVNKTANLAEKSGHYDGKYEKFALLNYNDNAETSIKNLKIEVISDYAVDDAEAYENSNGNVKYSAIVHNNSGNPVTGAVLVAAAYDADKNLIGATVIDDYTGAAGKQLVDGEIEIEEGEAASEVVIYFWDNFDSAYPLYDPTTIEL